MLELQKVLQEYRSDGTHDGTTAAIAVYNEQDFRLGKYRDGQLLKFRGIICDVQDPELVYLTADEDDAGAPMDQQQIIQNAEDLKKGFVERFPLKVAICAQTTAWATEVYSQNASSSSNKSSNEVEMGETKRAMKRSLEAEEHDQAMDTQDNDINDENDAMNKRSRHADNQPTKDDASSPSTFVQQYVNVYVYEGQYKDLANSDFKVNQSFEFIGVLDLQVLGTASTATTTNDDKRQLTADELNQLQISDCIESIQQKDRTGAVLHCCEAVALDNVHYVFPNAPRSFYTQLKSSNHEKLQQCRSVCKSPSATTDEAVAGIRAKLVRFLAQHLAGDLVAAEYLLLCLLAHVYNRVDATTPLGNLSLNVMLGKPTAQCDRIQSILSSLGQVLPTLVPLFHSVNVSIKRLNEAQFVPRKEYEHDQLVGGELQVPHGTTLLLNETALSAGQLTEQGVKNLGALQSLVEKMTIPYDFQYYCMDFPQDVAIISVSETNSILPVTVSIQIQPPSTAEDKEEDAEDWIHGFRVYLSVLRSLNVTIGSDEASMAEAHYVDCRKAKQDVSSDDLHRWLRLARLIALSFGHERLTRAHWEHMLALEAKRQKQNPANETH